MERKNYSFLKPLLAISLSILMSFVWQGKGTADIVYADGEENNDTVVTEETFFDFFDDSGYLLQEVDADMLTFKGEFDADTLGINYIVLTRPITIISDTTQIDNKEVNNAVLNNIGFIIDGEEIILDGLTLNATDLSGDLIAVMQSYTIILNMNITYKTGDESATAINVHGADEYDTISDINILDNNIVFENKTTTDEYLVNVINLENVEDVTVDSNQIEASIPALYVDTYDWEYFLLGLCYVSPVRIYGAYTLEFTNNTLEVSTNSTDSKFPTSQAVYIVGSDNVFIDGNTITLKDNYSSVGTALYCYGLICGFNEDIYINNNTIDVSTTGGKSGSSSLYGVYLATTKADVIGNTITCSTPGPVIGIHSPFGFGPAKDIIINGNDVQVSGYADTTDEYSLISGIEIGTGYSTIKDNTITVKNTNKEYDDEFPVAGISAIQYSASTLSFDIQDNLIDTNGKYTVHMLYSPQEATVTGNTLYAKELAGDDSVYFKNYDSAIIQNNKPQPTPTPTPTPSATPEATPSATPEATPSATPEATPSATPEVTPTATPEVTPTATPEVTPSATPEATPSATPEVTPSATPEVTPSATPEVTPSATPEATPSATPEVTPSAAPEVTPTATPEVTPTPTQKDKEAIAAAEAADEKSLKNVESTILNNADSDSDPKDSVFSQLQAKVVKPTSKGIKITWKAIDGADYYVIYGNACGKKNKMVRLGETTGKTFTVKDLNGTKLKKGKYYKVLVVAVGKTAGYDQVLSTSKVVHAATAGSKKVTNPKKITVKKSKVSLKKGKRFTIKAKVSKEKKKLTIKKHRAISYESSDTSIATVSKKGVIKAKSKGTATIYVYAQNGVCKKIKVTVK